MSSGITTASQCEEPKAHSKDKNFRNARRRVRWKMRKDMIELKSSVDLLIALIRQVHDNVLKVEDRSYKLFDAVDTSLTSARSSLGKELEDISTRQGNIFSKVGELQTSAAQLSMNVRTEIEKIVKTNVGITKRVTDLDFQLESSVARTQKLLKDTYLKISELKLVDKCVVKEAIEERPMMVKARRKKNVSSELWLGKLKEERKDNDGPGFDFTMG